MNNIKITDDFYEQMESVMVDAYQVGPLMYSPGTTTDIYEKLLSGVWGNCFSLALCLEDSIDDNAVEIGERTVVDTLHKIYENQEKLPFFPKLFIRVRNPQQIGKLYHMLSHSSQVLCGFILPKFVPANAPLYIEEILQINQNSNHKIYMMPILESGELVSYTTRYNTLEQLHKQLLSCREYVLNVRVGGNDLCHLFGVRRNANETIYDIKPIAGVLGDIITYFFNDFVVSAPVWEYFADENDNWKTGLENELRMDVLNGFIGKTIIHPNQIPVVANAMKANAHDVADAMRILNFENPLVGVSKSASGTRMNEMKTHTNWAKKQILLAKIYGVR